MQWTLGKGFTPRTRKRPRVDVIKNTHLKPSCHCTGTMTMTSPTQKVTYVIRGSCSGRNQIQQNEQEQHSPKQTQPRRVSTQWVRTIRSLVPVRGLTRPSIPSPLHWSEENWPEISSKTMDFFLYIDSWLDDILTDQRKQKYTLRQSRDSRILPQENLREVFRITVVGVTWHWSGNCLHPKGDLQF